MKTDTVYSVDQLDVHKRGAITSQCFFSHGGFYDAERIQFGTLRLLNNNYYNGLGKCGLQYHRDLEVLIIPLSGAIEYTDNRANCCIIPKGNFIAISAGSGIEYAINSATHKEPAHYIKLWFLPKKRGLTPRHSIHSIDADLLHNMFYYLVSPVRNSKEMATLNQDAWVALSELMAKTKLTYHKKNSANGIFIRVCEGEIKVRGHYLMAGDSIAFEDKDNLIIEGVKKALFLLLEVPMTVTLYNSDEKITIPPKL